MSQKRKKDKNEPVESPEYRRLVETLRAIIEEAASNGIDLRKRQDALVCRACGAYEKQAIKGFVVYDIDHHLLRPEEFIIIDQDMRSYRRNRTRYYKTTYTFICSDCGVYQDCVLKEHFKD